jgi:murein DD-endopeptidase MepM/ murein hydrolase activator NlpD
MIAVRLGLEWSFSGRTLLQTLAAVLLLNAQLLASEKEEREAVATHGGGSLDTHAQCILPEEEARIRASGAHLVLEHPAPLAAPPPPGVTRYPFWPMAGNLWEDLFPGNFVDLNPSSPGILDYNNTDYTYDGHAGIDVSILTFTEQAIGVPVFAAIPGVVTAAHDGEDDMNTTAAGQPANYVILRHTGTHDSWYLHLKKNSVAVSVGQQVKAGQQLGLTASSGNSTGPHLHFQSQNNGAPYEPFTGPANPGTSGWVNQPPFRSTMYLRDFNVTLQNLSGWHPPFDTSRTGTLVGSGFIAHSFWAVVQNIPAASNYRIRYLRPNGTLRWDSGTVGFNNPFHRDS